MYRLILSWIFSILISIPASAGDIKECKLPVYAMTPAGVTKKQTDEIKALALCVSLALFVMDPVHVVHAVSEGIDTVQTEIALNPEFARGVVGMVNTVRGATRKTDKKSDKKIIESSEKLSRRLTTKASSVLMGATTFAAKAVAVTVALECEDVLRHAFDKGETYRDRIIRIHKTIDAQQDGVMGYLKGVIKHQWIVAAQGFEWVVCHGFDFEAAKNAIFGNDSDFAAKLGYGEVCEWGRDKEKCKKWIESGYLEEAEHGHDRDHNHNHAGRFNVN